MKKFTKIMLIIAGSLAALGIVFSGIAAVMGAGWSTIHRKALAGELDFDICCCIKDNSLFCFFQINNAAKQ